MLKDNLIILRNINGYSQEEIAEKINISRQAYAKWESGATVPDIEKCMRIAEIYGVSLDSLVKTETVDGIHALPPAPAGKNIWGSITINERGQRLIVLTDDTEGIALVPAEMFESRMQKAMEFASKSADE